MISFFRYCDLHGSRSPAKTQEDSPPVKQDLSPIITKTTRTGDEEVELITDYSWRNFFAAINFVHILQKLTKGRIHRILLLVQYKSSVGGQDNNLLRYVLPLSLNKTFA